MQIHTELTVDDQRQSNQDYIFSLQVTIPWSLDI